MSGLRATACTPPKKRFFSVQRRTVQPRLLEALERRLVDARLGVHLPALHVDARSRDGLLRPAARGPQRRARSAGSPSGSGSSPRCRCASSGRPSRSTTVGAIMLGTRAPGAMLVEAERVQVLLAQHVVQVHAGAGHHHARARAVRAGHRRAGALGVHHRDVRRVAEPRAHLRRHRVERLLGQEALEEALAGRAPRGTPRRARGWWTRSPRRSPYGSCGRSSRSRMPSASAIRIPPDEGGGLVSTSRPW